MIDISIILCEDSCKYCGERFVKNPLCSGDWYPIPDQGIVLQRYCQNCGVMKPYLSFNSNRLSKTDQYKISVACAGKLKRGMTELRRITRSIKTHDKNKFFNEFSEKSNIPIKMVKATCSEFM